MDKQLIHEYSESLKSLDFPAKPLITHLTIIAGENIPHAGTIASVIASFVPCPDVEFTFGTLSRRLDYQEYWPGLRRAVHKQIAALGGILHTICPR